MCEAGEALDRGSLVSNVKLMKRSCLLWLFLQCFCRLYVPCRRNGLCHVDSSSLARLVASHVSILNQIAILPCRLQGSQAVVVAGLPTTTDKFTAAAHRRLQVESFSALLGAAPMARTDKDLPPEELLLEATSGSVLWESAWMEQLERLM